MGARGRREREGNMWIGEFTMERERKNMPHANCQMGGKRRYAISKT
jgi:hypothetical protein